MRKLALVFVLLAAGSPQDKPAVDVLVDGPLTLAPGSTASLRVAVTQSLSFSETNPVTDARVAVSLARRVVWSGDTDKAGTAAVRFTVPELKEGKHALKVTVRSDTGESNFEQRITVRRGHKVLLVTDKPMYQPAQTIRIRALVLEEQTLRAAVDRDLVIEVQDAKGNKVFRSRTKTSEFGVASADFTLADEVNMGGFRITAVMGKAKAEKTVTVEKYVLPKFKVVLETEKPWYAPRALVKGHVQADYFFGKPVEGKVTLTCSTFDAGPRKFATLDVTCDAQGRAEFEFRLPDYFVGAPIEKGNARVQIEAEVIDKADQVETASRSLVVASQPVRVSVIAESGKLVPGVENQVYVVATTPDGSPLETKVEFEGKKGRTNLAGFAKFAITPDKKKISSNAKGKPVYRTTASARGVEVDVEIPLEASADTILLRIDKAIYQGGDTAKLEFHSSMKKGTVFLDVVKKGQTVLTSSVSLEEGRASYPLAVDPTLFGAIEIHAYVLLPSGDIVRDTRVAYVQPAHSLEVAVSTDLPEYRPGQTCTIKFRVTDEDGAGRQAALGVIVVDESVYALQDMQSGLEKIYFTLEKELSKPKIEVHTGHSLSGAIRQARQEVAGMLLANVEPPLRRWNVNTLAQRKQAFQGNIQKVYWAVYNYAYRKRGELTVKDARTGERRLRPDLLERLVKEKRITADDLVDPWGRPVTLKQLQKLMPGFEAKFWWRLLSWNAIWQAHHKLDQRARIGEAFPQDLGKDAFGDPLTLDLLAKLDPVFGKENLDRLRVDRRRAAIFAMLESYAVGRDVLVAGANGTWSYRDGVLEEVAAVNPVNKRVIGDWTLEDLMKASPAFSPENLSKRVTEYRGMRLFNAIRALLQASSAEKVAAFDAGQMRWTYRKSLLDELVASGKLTEVTVRDAAGKKFDLGALSKKVPALSLGNMVRLDLQTKMAQIYNGLQNLGNRNRRAYRHPRKGYYMFPSHVLAQVKAPLNDPWGRQIRLVKLEKERQPRWYWFPMNELVSAGPDGKFGTADDYGEAQVLQARHYGIGWMGGRAYAHDPKVLQPTQAGLWGDNDRFALFGMARGFRGGRRELLRARNAAPAPMKAPMAANQPMAEFEEAAGELRDMQEGDKGGAAGEELSPAARVREYFPETLFWAPQFITEKDGTAELPLAMADSITTWRLTASANTADGLLGSTTHGIRVFQDFFVDIDFPVALTQNDRVSVPVAIFNYLKEDQKVQLRVEKEDWFELLDDEIKTVEMGAGQVKAVYYSIRVRGLGRRTLTVHARGTRLSDAVRRAVEIVPDGKKFEQVLNDRLEGNMSHVFDIPDEAIDGASKILFKAYPGVFSSVLDGLEGMLRMPGG